MADPLISWNNCCCHCDAEIDWKNVEPAEVIFPFNKEWVFRRYECKRCRKQLLVFRQDECSFGIIEVPSLGSLYQCSMDVEPKLSLERCDTLECKSCKVGSLREPVGRSKRR